MSPATPSSGGSTPSIPRPTRDLHGDECVSEAELRIAIERLEGGGCVALPTETVWGLAACARSESAVASLRAFKGRAEAQPISLLVPDPEGLESAGFDVSPGARKLMAAFWPGPLTLVLPCTASFAQGIAREDGAVGLRCSPHPVASAMARAAREAGLGPLTATSLNRTGEPPAKTEHEARALCGADDTRPHVLSVRSDAPPDGVPSTVLDLTGSVPEILRVGALSAETLYPYLAVGTDTEPDQPAMGDQRE